MGFPLVEAALFPAGEFGVALLFEGEARSGGSRNSALLRALEDETPVRYFADDRLSNHHDVR